jgi:DNA polymerase-3 subunit alpha
VQLDLAGIETADEQPFVLLAAAERLDATVIAELKRTLEVHRGETPVQLKLLGGNQETLFALDGFSVRPSSTLLGELKAIPGISANV